MDVERIEYPNHLNEHGLSHQTLDALPDESKRALAKELAVINRKLEWLIQEAIWLHNLCSDHDRNVETLKRLFWLAGIVLTVATTGITVWKLLK